MRIFSLPLLFALISFPAAADWMPYLESGGYRFYIDLETIKRGSNGMPRVWVMSNLTNQSENGESSSKLLVEANCADDQIRFLAIRTYSQQMGKGKLIYESDIATPWKYLQTDNSSHGFILKTLCASAGQK